MLRLSPSLIDSYRYWRENDHANLDDLIASIKGERKPPTEAMARGTAWHWLMEGRGGEVEVDGMITVRVQGFDIRFLGDDVRGVRSQLRATSHVELRGTLELPEIGVRMNLRTDGVAGNTIDEHKTTGQIDVDRYIRSAQWRAYLLAFGCRRVVYHLVRVYYRKREGVWKVNEYLPIEQYAYPSMREDLVADAADLAEFIRGRGLAHYREDESNADDSEE